MISEDFKEIAINIICDKCKLKDTNCSQQGILNCLDDMATRYHNEVK